MIYPKLSDMVPKPFMNWCDVSDYAVYSLNRGLIISPHLFGFKHVEASHQFDQRCFLDRQYGLNRVNKYIYR